MTGTQFRWLTLVALVLTAGCSRVDRPTQPPAARNAAPVPEHELILPAEPAGAKGVLAVRQGVQDGAEVVIMGRIAGRKQPVVPGRAAFTIVDVSLEPCCEDDCPWVFCCTPRAELLAAMVLVKFVDDQGKTLRHDARHLLGVKEWQTVVVHGKARRDEAGNLTTILADGLYIRP